MLKEVKDLDEEFVMALPLKNAKRKQLLVFLFSIVANKSDDTRSPRLTGPVDIGACVVQARTQLLVRLMTNLSAEQSGRESAAAEFAKLQGGGKRPALNAPSGGGKMQRGAANAGALVHTGKHNHISDDFAAACVAGCLCVNACVDSMIVF